MQTKAICIIGFGAILAQLAVCHLGLVYRSETQLSHSISTFELLSTPLHNSPREPQKSAVQVLGVLAKVLS